MENSSPLVLEISSDEESDFGCVRKGVDGGGGGGEYGDKEDCNWLSKLLDEVGGKNDDDSDDVVFVSEVLPRNPKKLKLAKVVDDDDDCVVLDGDPDKQMVVFNAKADNNDDSDDLEIVGEKGEVPSSGGSRSAQSFPPHAVFKRSGPAGVSSNNMQAYRSQLSRDKTVRSSQTPLLNVRHRSNPQRVLGPAAHSVPHQPNLSSSPHNVDVGCENYLPSQSHIQSVPFSNSLIRDPIHGQSQVSSQPYLRSNFASAVPSQTNVASQPSEENFQSLILPQLDLYQPSIPVLSQTAPSYHFGNQSSQPDAHSNNSTPLFTDGQNAFQQGNHVQNSISESPTDFGFASDSSIGHGNMQIHAEVSPCQSEEPAYDSQHQSIAINNDHHQSIAAVVNFHQENVVTTDNSSLINDNENRFPGSIGPDLLDFQFDNWMFENHSLPAVFEVPLSPVWNVFSPEPSSIDTGTLFDI
ncbi:hypothetical protein MIMGU_mgv1a005871mg [Erythranthe guttata]|uniref:Uncharacterized protein n=1 Tax=Erythranthe guttata TaxID=4155 RepID=A0A022S298_ERYGU|nr:hypothetical protein MIMGU_mgv1a005871mg [Erythranthe guttata]